MPVISRFLSALGLFARSRKPNPFARWPVLLCWFSLCPSLVGAVPGIVHHDLQVQIDPAARTLAVVDQVALPANGPGDIVFLLARGLQAQAEGAVLQELDHPGGDRFRAYRLTMDARPGRVTLRYGGTLAAGDENPEHGMPTAVLGADGVILNGASGWYPQFGNAPVTFRLRVALPPGWDAVSQGMRQASAGAVTWETRTPQDDIYLLAGPYRRYARSGDGPDREVYLLGEDPVLAERYLGVLSQYLAFYGELLGEYPYPKFAVVENRWQTGYGMPSFTLLGSRVLRLPFILHSSLPHEVLHNWWGNGVYVDPAGGNWSEGLTAYLADHLIKEVQGDGAAYRRQALERYANFAAERRDFAVRRFVARHSDASQAVGYGKTMMLFHMLRRELGDAAFVAALRAFWREYRFRSAGFDQLRSAFERQAGRPLGALAADWLDRPGAPALALDEVRAEPAEEGGYRLHVAARQVQGGAPYPMRVPVVVQTVGAAAPLRAELVFTGREAKLDLVLAERPERVDVDPDFDVFRLLDAVERPPTLGRAFGATTQWLVLPGDAPAAERQAWQALAGAWAGRYGNVRTVDDRDLGELPDDGAVWLLGWRNRWLGEVAGRFAGAGQALGKDEVRVDGTRYGAAEHAVVLLDPDNLRSPLGFIGAVTPAQIAGLARKLPHYGSAGRLVFGTADLVNQRRDALPLAHSPLSRVLGAHDPGPPPAGNLPLARLVGQQLRFR